MATAIAGVLGVEARPSLASGAEDNSFIALLRENSLAHFAASLMKAADFASADEVSRCSEAELEELGLEVGMKKMALKRFVNLSQLRSGPAPPPSSPGAAAEEPPPPPPPNAAEQVTQITLNGSVCVLLR